LGLILVTMPLLIIVPIITIILVLIPILPSLIYPTIINIATPIIPVLPTISSLVIIIIITTIISRLIYLHFISFRYLLALFLPWNMLKPTIYVWATPFSFKLGANVLIPSLHFLEINFYCKNVKCYNIQ